RLPLTAAEVSAQVGAGFTEIIDWIIAHRAGFVALVEELFTGVGLRYLHNPTMFYGQMLRMCTHSSVLTYPEARHILLHRVALRRRDAPAVIARAEHRDLTLRDVPYFTFRSDSTELFDSDGASLGFVLDEPPLRAAVEKIQALTPDERDAQLTLISCSFVNKLPGESDQTGFVWPGTSGDPDADERLP